MGFATPHAHVREDTASALTRLSLRDAPPPQPMEVSGMLGNPVPSSSSFSSSESDTGMFTNDEGREGKVSCLIFTFVLSHEKGKYRDNNRLMLSFQHKYPFSVPLSGI